MVVYLFFMPNMKKTAASKLACLVMLFSLSLIQIAHYFYFNQGVDLLSSRIYGGLLTLIPSAFFFFGREVLYPKVEYHWYECLHALPFVMTLFFIPIEFSPVLAFVVGSAYTIWFTWVVFSLRHGRQRFKFEMFFFGLFALMAVFALLLGLALPFIDNGIFYTSYSNAIAIAVLLIVLALLIFPELLTDILLVAELAYAKTKLQGIDVMAKRQALEGLMDVDKLYQNEDIKLATIADTLELSVHQLSELINTEYGFSFPRFIREYRVNAAKKLLLADKKVSILAISMETGFKSQSNFYAAFNETTGMSPGKYRKQNLN